MFVRALCDGPIPADAGEPPYRYRNHDPRRAYPRGRGGAPYKPPLVTPGSGLSPRTRGSPRITRRTNLARRPIPADAGEPYEGQRFCSGGWAYPRGRGGALEALVISAQSWGLSPRTRGSLREAVEVRHHPGPIPADAGEPRPRVRSCPLPRAYPRGRGGARSALADSRHAGGLSPRTRGSPASTVFTISHSRPIPADAGEPLGVKPMTPKGKHTIASFRIVKDRGLAAWLAPPTCHPSRPALSVDHRDGQVRLRPFRYCRARP